MDLNKFAKRAYQCALKRGKVHENLTPDQLHQETAQGLTQETTEVVEASEELCADHVPSFTEVQEELADVIIVACTELYRRGTDVEALLHAKMKYNEHRD